MNIRKAFSKDLTDIIEIYSIARNFMKNNGNPLQWANGYPQNSIIQQDIKSGNLYVIEDDAGISGVFALIKGKDPTYEIIKNGKWLSNSDYYTIHRVASNGRIKGIVKATVDFAQKQNKHLRIDTHAQNTVMQNALIKAGFKYCGIIFLENGEERLAYEFV